MTTTVDGPLWVTLRGASRRLPLAWVAWMVLAAAVGPVVADHVGPAGAAILVLGAGWLLARRLPAPIEWLRRYHLDDVEVTEIGPGARVRRLAWSAVETVTQSQDALTLGGDRITVRVPLLAVLEHGAWGAVLARVMPALADEMWAVIEDGEEVRLAPGPEPAARALVWWAYAPALLSCAAGAGAAALVVTVGLVALERALAFGRARAGAVTLHRAGLALGTRGAFVAWSRAEVLRVSRGLLVRAADGPGGRVGVSLPNFWAAAPVVELKAQLGPGPGARVHFRVRVAEGRLAVVGEVEPAA